MMTSSLREFPDRSYIGCSSFCRTGGGKKNSVFVVLLCFLFVMLVSQKSTCNFINCPYGKTQRVVLVCVFVIGPSLFSMALFDVNARSATMFYRELFACFATNVVW